MVAAMALTDALKGKTQPQITPLYIVVGDSLDIGPAPVTVDGVTQDFTGCTAAAKVLSTDGGSTLLTLTGTVPTPASGIVQFTDTPAHTAALAPATDGAKVGVWSATITDAGGAVVTFVRGDVFAYYKRA